MKTIVVSLLAASLSAGAAGAAPIVLDFEGVGNSAPVGSFYDGNGGPDYDIVFSPNALGIIDADAGGGGNFGNEPSPDTILFFLGGGAATMNVLNGFTTGFSFFYTSTNFAGAVNVWSGMDGTGTLLATLMLDALGPGSGDPNGDFSNWAPVGVTFAGTAYSVDFAGTANQIGFDNITLGSATPGGPSPVPVPASLPLLLAGLGSLAFAARRKRA